MIFVITFRNKIIVKKQVLITVFILPKIPLNIDTFFRHSHLYSHIFHECCWRKYVLILTLFQITYDFCSSMVKPVILFTCGIKSIKIWYSIKIKILFRPFGSRTSMQVWSIDDFCLNFLSCASDLVEVSFLESRFFDFLKRSLNIRH